MNRVLEQLNPKQLMNGFAVILLVSLFSAILLQNVLPLVIPVGLVLLAAFIMQFERLFVLLFILIPVSIEFKVTNSIGTDFPSEPLMWVLMIGAIFFFLLNPKKINRAFFGHTLIAWAMIYFIWIAITAIFSGMPIVSFKFLIAKTWYYVVFLFLGGHFLRDEKSFTTIFWAVFFPLCFAVSVVIIKHASYGFDFEMVNKTMHPFFRNHVNYAVLLAVFFPYMYFIWRNQKHGSLSGFVIFLGMILLFAGIVFSYTRAAYITLLLIPIGYFIFSRRLAIPAIILSVALLTLGFGWLAKNNNYTQFAPGEDTVYHLNFEDHIGATFELKDMSTMERFHRWIAAFRMMPDLSITGYGPGTFYHYYKPYTSLLFETYVSENEDQSTVHNYFLLLVIEQGWIGLLLFMGMVIYLFLVGQRAYHNCDNVRDKRIIMAVLVSALIILTNNFMADLVEVDKVGSFFFINMALIINFDLKYRKGKEEIQ